MYRSNTVYVKELWLTLGRQIRSNVQCTVCEGLQFPDEVGFRGSLWSQSSLLTIEQVKKVLLEGFLHGYLLKKRIVGYPLRIEELRRVRIMRDTVSTALHKRNMRHNGVRST